ncbi:MAG TPA: DoxX family protein [Chitinophagales bacterium]|nr:DoxX family protein [Chitinophagales bacterium]
MKRFLFNANATYLNFGLLFLRVAIGSSFIYHHGFRKISDPSIWNELGGAMDIVGITFAPTFWGFMASFAEFFGSVFLILGLFTRPAAFLLSFTMFIVVYSAYVEGDGFSYPLSMLIVFISIMIIGPGKYSIDAQINGFKK